MHMPFNKIRIVFKNGFWEASLVGYRPTGVGPTPLAALSAFKAACIGVHSNLQLQ